MATSPVLYKLPAKTPRFNFDYGVGGYVRNQLASEYLFNTGKIVVPVMGDPNYPATEDTTVSVQVCSPYGFKVVSFHLGRVGIKPRLPSPQSNDPNLEFLGGRLWLPAPVILNDLVTYVYEAAGVYYYRCLKPVWTAEGFTLGASTVDRTPGAANMLGGPADANRFFPIDATDVQQKQA